MVDVQIAFADIRETATPFSVCGLSIPVWQTRRGVAWLDRYGGQW